jgi:hypothetical protein
MIVTTADHFSKDAKRDVREVLDKGLVEKFDLIDYQSFHSILSSHYGANAKTCDDVLRLYLDSDGQHAGGHIFRPSRDDIDKVFEWTANGPMVDLKAAHDLIEKLRFRN